MSKEEIRNTLRATTCLTFDKIDALLDGLQNAENDNDKEAIFKHIAWHIPTGGPKMTMSGEDGKLLKKEEILKNIRTEYLGEDDEAVFDEGEVAINITSTGKKVVGEILATSVTLTPGDKEGTMIRVRGTVTPAGAAIIKYKEGDKWLDLPMKDGEFYFGASVGFPLTAAGKSEFYTQYTQPGDVTTTLEVIEVATGEVIGSGSATITIEPAPEEVPSKDNETSTVEVETAE